MACHQVVVFANVSSSHEDVDALPDDQEFMQQCDTYRKFTRACFFTADRDDFLQLVEDVLSLEWRLCRRGSHLVEDQETGCFVKLDRPQIDNIVRTILERVERELAQNPHRKRIPVPAKCEVLIPHGSFSSWAFPDQAATVQGVPVTRAAVNLEEKSKTKYRLASSNKYDNVYSELMQPTYLLAPSFKRARLAI